MSVIYRKLFSGGLRENKKAAGLKREASLKTVASDDLTKRTASQNVKLAAVSDADNPSEPGKGESNVTSPRARRKHSSKRFILARQKTISCVKEK